MDEVVLVPSSVTFFVGVLELVEGGVFRVEQLAVPPEESLVQVPDLCHAQLLGSTATGRGTVPESRRVRGAPSTSPSTVLVRPPCGALRPT
jgi:hypothetical protein